ncbi:amidohydrolase family protein [Effusibacillus consociatus]|uniref:Amidohydrolase family protein n=1 Tax=Effusibacillus consociatus TaxID=1117041 RepID=A0ABV9Q8V2_9BACL
MIDAHMHAFPERLMTAIYDWFRHIGWNIPYDGWQAEELFDYQNQHGFERFLVLLYVHKPGMARGLNDWLATQVKLRPEIVPIGCVHHQDDVEIETERCLGELGFAGMKLHCAVQNISMDDRRLDPLYETLIRYDRPLIVHAGTAPDDYTGTVGVKYFARAIDRYPELRVQVAHFGLYESESFFRLADEFPGIVFDTAAIDTGTLGERQPTKEQMKEWIERFSDRILYGSDLPFLNGEASNVSKVICDLQVEPSVIRAVFEENARRFWRIK